MRRSVSIWQGGSVGHPDAEDPDVHTVAFSVKEGVELLDVQVYEGTLLIIRARVPEEIRAQGEPL